MDLDIYFDSDSDCDETTNKSNYCFSDDYYETPVYITSDIKESLRLMKELQERDAELLKESKNKPDPVNNWAEEERDANSLGKSKDKSDSLRRNKDKPDSLSAWAETTLNVKDKLIGFEEEERKKREKRKFEDENMIFDSSLNMTGVHGIQSHKDLLQVARNNTYPARLGRFKRFYQEMFKIAQALGVAINHPMYREKYLISLLLNGRLSVNYLLNVRRFYGTMFDFLRCILTGERLCQAELIRVRSYDFKMFNFLNYRGFTYFPVENWTESKFLSASQIIAQTDELVELVEKSYEDCYDMNISLQIKNTRRGLIKKIKESLSAKSYVYIYEVIK